MVKQIAGYIGIVLSLLVWTEAIAQAQDGVGQAIQIQTRLNSFTGRPSWLLMIRDIDHNQNIPYVYDITRGDNFWIAFTYGRNYLITASTMQFAPYRSNPYRAKVTNDFCHLESRGKIARGESLYITIEGDLSPDTSGYTCQVTRVPDTRFSVPTSD